MKDSINDNMIWSEVIDLPPAWTWETHGDYRPTYICLQGLEVPGLRTEDLIGLLIPEGHQQHSIETGSRTYMMAPRDKKIILNHCYEPVLVKEKRAVLMDTAILRYDVEG